MNSALLEDFYDHLSRKQLGLPPASVITVDHVTGFVTVCAWCNSKADGEQWASAAGLTVSHGICPACGPKVFGGENRPSCAVGSATAGRDRQNSEKQIAVAEVAKIVGLAEAEIVRHFGELCFRPGYDFEQRPEGVILRRAVLPELVGELAVSGRTGAAARLMQWLTTSGGAVPAEKVYSTPLGPRPAAVALATAWYQRGAMA
jgi:hypothetical protein